MTLEYVSGKVNVEFTPSQITAFHALGDANGDGYINSKDTIIVTECLGLTIAQVQAAMGSKVGDPNYDLAADINGDGYVNVLDLILFEDADINGDGVINVLDLIPVSQNQGLDIWTYNSVKKPTQINPVYVAVGATAVIAAILGGIYAYKKRKSK